MNEATTGVRNEDLGIIAELHSRLPPPVERRRCGVYRSCKNADPPAPLRRLSQPRSLGSREHSTHRRPKGRLPLEGVAGIKTTRDRVMMPQWAKCFNRSPKKTSGISPILPGGNLRDQRAPSERRVHCRSSILARVLRCTRTGWARR